MLLAALLKLLDVRSFSIDLAAWELVPDDLAAPLAVAVVALEISLPLLWLQQRDRRWPTVLLGFMLLAYTFAYCLESILASPPNCACFGEILQFQRHESRLHSLLIRNGVLIAMLAASLFLARSRGQRQGGAA